jgi:hypothetical protein
VLDDPFEKRHRGARCFVLGHSGQAGARGIVDRHVDDIPAYASMPMQSGAGDAMAGRPDPPELFGIEVDQLAGMLHLVSPRRRCRIQITPARKSRPLQDSRHGRRRHRDLLGNPSPGPALAAQRNDLRLTFVFQPARRSMGSTRAVPETGDPFDLKTTPPHPHRGHRSPDRLRHFAWRLTSLQALNQDLSTAGRQTRILVHWLFLFGEWVAVVRNLSFLSPSGRNNLLKPHT